MLSTSWCARQPDGCTIPPPKLGRFEGVVMRIEREIADGRFTGNVLGVSRRIEMPVV